MGKQHLSRDDRIFMDGKLQGTRDWLLYTALKMRNVD